MSSQFIVTLHSKHIFWDSWDNIFSILKSPFLFPATHPPPRCHAPLARPFTYDISPRPAPHFLYCYLVSSRARSLPSVHFAPVPFPRVHTAYDTVRLSVIHRLLGPDVFPYLLFSDLCRIPYTSFISAKLPHILAIC